MKQIKRASGVKDGREYFLRRHGGWFRPAAHGYTDDISHAGLFSALDARGYMQAEGVTAVRADLMKLEILHEMDSAIARASNLSVMFQRLFLVHETGTN
jgi:hypothetical protein